jgi:hypothetical protein
VVAAFALIAGTLSAAPAQAVGGFTVTIHVTELAGATDLEFASVDLTGETGDEPFTANASTGSDGIAVLTDVPSDSYSLMVQRSNYVLQQVPFVVAGADVAKDVTLVASNSSLHGVVLDKDGQPMPGIWVDATTETGGHASADDATGPDGAYSLSGLGAGDWTVSAFANVDGYEPFEQVVTIAANEDHEFDVHMVAQIVGTVEGTVRGSNGSPLKNIQVDIRGKNGDGDWYGQYGGTTDAAGHFSAHVSPGTDYTLRVWSLTANWLTTYYGNHTALDDGEHFDVVVDQTTTLNPTTMGLGGRLVTQISKATPDGKALVDPQSFPAPTIYRKVADAWVVWEIMSPFAGTTKGAIETNALPAGQYKVAFISDLTPERAFITKYWSGKSSLDTATIVTIKSGQTTTLANTTLVYPKPTDDVEDVADEELDGAPEVGTVSDAEQGETFTIDVGEQYAGEWVAITAHSDPEPMSEGWVRVDSKGHVQGTVDYAVPAGEHTVIVQFADDQVLGTATLDVAEDPIPNVFTTKPVPTLSGTVAVGSTVTAKPGTWKPTPGSFGYRWLLDGVVIPGATDPTYVPTVSQLGGKLSVEVTASRLGILDPAATRVSTQITIGLGKLHTVTPTVTGIRKVGSILTANPGAWTDGTTFTYKWYRDGILISGAQDIHYTPQPADVGKHITVKVTGSATGYASASKTSSSNVTTTVKGTLTKPASIDIDGTPVVGSLLGIAIGGSFGPVPVKLSFQWYVGGNAVTGATKSTFTPTPSNVRQKVKVKVKATATGYNSTTVTTAETGAVVKGTFSGQPIPVISAAQVGVQAKVVSLAGWVPAPSTFTYKWFLDGSATPVATTSRYTPTTSDLGKQLTVQVTAKRAGFDTASQVSVDVEVTAAPTP